MIGGGRHPCCEQLCVIRRFESPQQRNRLRRQRHVANAAVGFGIAPQSRIRPAVVVETLLRDLLDPENAVVEIATCPRQTERFTQAEPGVCREFRNRADFGIA